MAYMTQEEFLKLREDAKQRRQNPTQNSLPQTGPRVGYLSIKQGDPEAVVRFAYTDQSQIYNDIITCHETEYKGKFRKVSCTRTLHEDIANCPICAGGQWAKRRIYVKLLEYTTNDDGSVVVTPKVFDRPESFVELLEGFFIEYGNNLSDHVFKIYKDGDNKYAVKYANQAIYNEMKFPKDFSAFNDYKVIGGPVLDMSAEKLVEAMNSGDLTFKVSEKRRQVEATQPAQEFRPAYVQEPQPVFNAEPNYYSTPNTYQTQDQQGAVRRVIYQ